MNTFSKIFSIISNEDDKGLANHILYTGIDSKRNLKSACNPKVEEELFHVQSYRKKLQDNYCNSAWSFDNYRKIVTKEGEQHILKVECSKGGKSDFVICKFLKVNGKFLLWEIN